MVVVKIMLIYAKKKVLAQLPHIEKFQNLETIKLSKFRIVEDFQNVALETSGGGRYGCDFEENSKSQFLMRIKDSIKSNSSSPQIVEFFKKSQNSR